MSIPNSARLPIISVTNLFHPLLNQNIQDMGQVAITQEIGNLAQQTPSPRQRYIAILLLQGRLGRNINCILERCTKDIRAHIAPTEYIQAVFEYILAQIQAGTIDQAVGARAVIRLYRSARRWGPTLNATYVERRILNDILADAIQRLPFQARQGL
jgi:sensor histidine kinase regulating citrate/malate metabolism